MPNVYFLYHSDGEDYYLIPNSRTLNMLELLNDSLLSNAVRKGPYAIMCEGRRLLTFEIM